MTIDESSGVMSVSAIDDELAKLQKQLIQCVEARKDYKEIADRILKLRDMRQKTNFDDSAREEYVTRINDILDFIRKQSSELTVFDEPEAGIDLWSFKNLISVFKKMYEQTNGSIIIISHQERILNIADRIIVIADGKIADDGKGKELLPDLLGTQNATGTCAVLKNKVEMD